MSALRQMRSSSPPHLKLVRPPLHVRVCMVDAIPMGQGRAFVIGEHTIALFRQRDGNVFAIDNACPHRGGPLAEGIAGGGFVICPLHGWKIELRSGRCAAESAGVRSHAVEIVDDELWVTLEGDA